MCWAPGIGDGGRLGDEASPDGLRLSALLSREENLIHRQEQALRKLHRHLKKSNRPSYPPTSLLPRKLYFYGSESVFRN